MTKKTLTAKAIAMILIVSMVLMAMPMALLEEGTPSLTEMLAGRTRQVVAIRNVVENPVAGDTATFTAQLHGYEGLRYTLQWQMNGVDLEKQVNPIYTLILADHNANADIRVKIVITGAEGAHDGYVEDYSEPKTATINGLAVPVVDETPASDEKVEVTAEATLPEVIVEPVSEVNPEATTEVATEAPSAETTTPAPEATTEVATEAPSAETTTPAPEAITEVATEIPAADKYEGRAVQEILSETNPNSKLTVYANWGEKDAPELGDLITLTAAIEGFEGVAYTLRWQVQKGENAEWTDIEGETGTTYQLTVGEGNQTWSWRIVMDITKIDVL